MILILRLPWGLNYYLGPKAHRADHKTRLGLGGSWQAISGGMDDVNLRQHKQLQLSGTGNMLAAMFGGQLGNACALCQHTTSTHLSLLQL